MVSDLRSLILTLANEYTLNKSQRFGGNEFASLIRKTGPEILYSVAARTDLFSICSVGQGNWAEIPWFGVFNPEVSVSATRGIYVVYLFSADMETVYLCQGQGVTAVKQDFGKSQYQELYRRSALIRDRVPEHKKSFGANTIKLNGKTTLAREYEPAVAYSKSYKINKLPDNSILEYELLEAIKLYDLLIARGGTDNLETAIDLIIGTQKNEKNQNIVETKRYIRHSKIERNTKASSEAKKILGTECQGCGLKFEKVYGRRGVGFIEAHHKIPLSELKEGQSVSMDPKQDFAVLCSNCHRMVHKGNSVLSIEQLRNLPGVKKLRNYYESL